MSKEWRPDDWHNALLGCACNSNMPCPSAEAYEDGASAMLTAVIKYLDQANDLNDLEKRLLGLQSSTALTNLMGKFPDLPDATEASK